VEGAAKCRRRDLCGVLYRRDAYTLCVYVCVRACARARLRTCIRVNFLCSMQGIYVNLSSMHKPTKAHLWSFTALYKVIQIWPGQTVTCLHTNNPGHIWTTLYILSDLRILFTIKMVTGVTEICRCRELKAKYIQQNSLISVHLMVYARIIRKVCKSNFESKRCIWQMFW
jgi:hypothetical protein